MAVLIFPKLETRFNIPTIKTRKKQKKGVSNSLIKTALRFSSAKITDPESRLETLNLRQMCDDKRTPWVDKTSEHVFMNMLFCMLHNVI